MQPQRPRRPRSPSRRPRKYNRIVQHGTQSRSERELGRARSRPSSRASSASCWSRAGSATSRAGASASSRTGTPPAELDFNLWLGPAPEQPFHANLVHYNWHWFWDFGNGDIGNQGVHQMDIARWVIPGATLPTKRRGASAAGSATRTRARRQHADRRLGLRRHAARLRGPRPGRTSPEDSPSSSRWATSITRPRA